jgi:hypothetical protein
MFFETLRPLAHFLFSKTFINKIHSIIRKFWWGGVPAENPTNPLAFRSWDDISKPKAQGGLGIRDMELINKSLLIHTVWNIVTDKNPFLSNILKAKGVFGRAPTPQK